MNVEERIIQAAERAARQVCTPNYILMCQKDFDELRIWSDEAQIRDLWRQMRLNYHDLTTLDGQMRMARRMAYKRGLKWKPLDWAKSKNLLGF